MCVCVCVCMFIYLQVHNVVQFKRVEREEASLEG